MTLLLLVKEKNYDIVNELSKYIMFPRGMKVQGGKHIIINQPKSYNYNYSSHWNYSRSYCRNFSRKFSRCI